MGQDIILKGKWERVSQAHKQKLNLAEQASKHCVSTRHMDRLQCNLVRNVRASHRFIREKEGCKWY